MAPTALVAAAVAMGLAFYVLGGVIVLLLAQLPAMPGAATEEERLLARYHASTISYTAGWRKLALALALVAYSCAAIDLFQGDASALLWLAAALALDCALFLVWRDRGEFLQSISPQERMSDLLGVSALGMALAVTAFLRFSGALA